MIKITVNKESEMIWIQRVIEAGVLNISTPHLLNYVGIPLKQNVTFIKGDDFEDDINRDKLKELKNKFGEHHVSPIYLENILRQEYEEKLRQEKNNENGGD